MVVELASGDLGTDACDLGVEVSLLTPESEVSDGATFLADLGPRSLFFIISR